MFSGVKAFGGSRPLDSDDFGIALRDYKLSFRYHTNQEEIAYRVISDEPDS